MVRMNHELYSQNFIPRSAVTKRRPVRTLGQHEGHQSRLPNSHPSPRLLQIEPSPISRSEFPRSDTQPRGPDHPNGLPLRAVFLEFGMVQTEPSSQGHVRTENGNKFRSGQLCRPQVTSVVSIGVVFLVGESRRRGPRARVSGIQMLRFGANGQPSRQSRCRHSFPAPTRSEPTCVAPFCGTCPRGR